MLKEIFLVVWFDPLASSERNMLLFCVHFKSHIDLISDPEPQFGFVGVLQTSCTTVCSCWNVNVTETIYSLRKCDTLCCTSHKTQANKLDIKIGDYVPDND